MTDSPNMEVVMSLIVYAGNAKSLAMEAIQAAKQGKFNEAKETLKEADASLVEAHHSQTSLLTKEAQGEKTELTLLMVHAQDHLMTSIAFADLAKEFVELYEKLDQ
ncbi:PTS lactose/cellobiose transporter subunit IIA [Vagococcus humatus]|uniref:PTS lactose/cellobiose transporter subunit IIA n=1 Tax=Vagococcus humatus TaxID=1889241 RepID=A0A3R9YY38_9ENTE|nr:PTS lactose/cellobiose transporter subunit IIA [Vagococcus humatus]RST90129.1 PTS lactose/cellobiose transporter subunit IIA [Vagococcus humatus]